MQHNGIGFVSLYLSPCNLVQLSFRFVSSDQQANNEREMCLNIEWESGTFKPRTVTKNSSSAISPSAGIADAYAIPTVRLCDAGALLL